MVTDVTMRANSLEEAIKMVEDQGNLPNDGQYLDSSFEVNQEAAEALNQKE